MRIDAKTYTIVGVMRPDFRYLSQKPSLWLPMAFDDETRKPESRHSNNMEMIARLAPGVTLPAAQAQRGGGARRGRLRAFPR